MPDEMNTGIADADPAVDAGGIAEDDKHEDQGGGGIADESAKANESAGGAEGAGAQGKTEPKKEPEPYELTAPEDFPIPEENLKSFTAKANELGLTKEQAEGILKWHQEYDASVGKYLQQNEANVLQAWGKEIGTDKEFGGANMKTTIADARKALEAFDTDGSLRALLRETKYQYNPAIIRAVARVGKAMGEHGFVGQNGAGKADIPLEERMYPDMKV